MKTKELTTATKTLIENRLDLALERTQEEKEKSIEALNYAQKQESEKIKRGFRYMTKEGLNYKALVAPKNFKKRLQDGWYFKL